MMLKRIHTPFLWLVLAAVLAASTGCDLKPGLPDAPAGQIKDVIPVGEGAERQLAQRVVDARQAYRWALVTLGEHYRVKANELKRIWTERELENLAQCMLFTFQGVADPVMQAGPSIESTDQATLVEMVVNARKDFQGAVNELSGFYQQTRQPWKAAVVETVVRRFDPVRTYMYFVDAEIPPADLKPDQVIGDAETLYARALAKHKDGWTLVMPTNIADQREALMMFLELVRKYPSSRRIGSSAYYIGLIYSRAFDENYRAIVWYDRAVLWDPNLDLPALYNAAVLADKKLSRPAMAVDLYARVVKTSANGRHVQYAKQRIAELTAPPGAR